MTTPGRRAHGAGQADATTRPIHPLLVAAGASVLVTAASYGLPEEYKALGVAAVFLGATYLMVVRGDDTEKIRHHGVSLGGIVEPRPLDWLRMGRDAVRACGWVLAAAAVTFPAFWLGFVAWYGVEGGFALPPPRGVADEVAGQLVVIALPEEVFYRGYLQTALDDRWGVPARIAGARLGAGVLVTSAFFALGHLATDMHLGRLAVFFPSLAFGWLRARSGGVGASVGYHALCNLFASFLLRGYGLAQ